MFPIRVEDDYVLPEGNHPGAFGFQRKYHKHEGVDIYSPEKTFFVRTIEAGIVVGLENFTGENSKPPTPWWNNTEAVLVEGNSGVFLYGEINYLRDNKLIRLGGEVPEGYPLGIIVPVLKKDKGKPMSMLHVELYPLGSKESEEWGRQLDPTPILKTELDKARKNHWIITR